MKKILILSSIWGHESIAKGVYDVLKDSGHITHLEVIRIDPFSEASYKTIYRFVPKLFKTSFNLSKYKIILRIVGGYFKNSYFKLIENSIEKYHPDVVISTYFGFTSSLGALKQKFKFRYINVVPDPWSLTKIHFTQRGLNLVFDEYAMTKIEKYTHIKNAINIGWFVETKFNKELSKEEACKILKIDPKALTICVTGGSEGMYDILKIINSFINLKKDVQILFMCGKNKQLYDLAKGFAKILGDNKKIKVFPFKYTSRMNLYMNASDLVIGKAGPNTIFESVACGVPFFAVSHISGQEDGNLDLIKKYNIGYAEENPSKIAKILKNIIKDPNILLKFREPIHRLCLYNKGSKIKLIELLKQ